MINHARYFAPAWALLAAVTVVGATLWLLERAPPADTLPPVEQLTIERVTITERGFGVHVRSDSNADLLIAQAMVDGAFWVFSQDPPGPIARLASAWIEIDYPWVAGEVHHLRFISSVGTTFDHSVDVALLTPRGSPAQLLDYALTGIAVGLLPIIFGMLFLPLVKSLAPAGLEFILALTVGLLGFLFVDMILAGLDAGAAASASFGGPALVIVALLLTLLALSVRRDAGAPAAQGRKLALWIAFGIGLHNFGEGLAIGAAFAGNELAMGTFLMVGFALHNTTEGLGLVAPLGRERTRFTLLASLALLAGLPTVPGIWLGALAFSPHYVAAFFGVGAGAIGHVVIEIDRFTTARARAAGTVPRYSAVSVAGYCCGAGIMYATALLIAV